RHTSFSRDWSSDVCSSDLPAQGRGDTVSATGANTRSLLPRPPPAGEVGWGGPQYPHSVRRVVPSNTSSTRCEVAGVTISGSRVHNGRAWCRERRDVLADHR